MTRIDINADLGEGFGRFSFGSDERLMKHITSANIACGWHGGDPTVMRSTVELAIANDVGIGAHPSYPDLMGWGMRTMSATPSEIYDFVMYQCSALDGFVRAAGASLRHVKPHGAMYLACETDYEMSHAMARAVRSMGDGVRLMLRGEIARSAAEDVGVPFLEEGYVDLEYGAKGELVVEATLAERANTDWDPEWVAARAVQVCTSNTITTIDGSTVELARPDSICLHADLPRVAESARLSVKTLEAAGVRVLGFWESDH